MTSFFFFFCNPLPLTSTKHDNHYYRGLQIINHINFIFLYFEYHYCVPVNFDLVGIFFGPYEETIYKSYRMFFVFFRKTRIAEHLCEE